ncbi:MAG: 6-hydroxymethylpterin diphosphokinase MptE-like protein, partial [Candidatus Nitrosotenuis sp.]
MSDPNELSIDEGTLINLIRLKKNAGFKEKTWDEWFNHTFKFESTPRDLIESVMEKLHYESFDSWVQNFAINLNYIWDDHSARELDPQQGLIIPTKEHSAIVLGRGPSIKKHRHLELIANSNYKGSIICGDGSLISALQAGITPDRFPKFYVLTIDPLERQRKLYDNALVDKYGKKINGIFSTVIHPSAVLRARQAGIKIHWVHPLFDYGDGKKSFNQISALMVRAKNHTDGLPAIQTGGNVGTAAWFVGWQILRCTTIALVGINHGWDEDDPWEK